MQLNVRQKKIVESDDSQIVCLSGPAVGKTRVLTERIKHLIVEKHVDPATMVAITFTNLAAMEMKKRLGDLVKEMFIGTIHSYANRICTLNHINMTDAIVEERFDEILMTASRIPQSNFPVVSHLMVDEAQDISDKEAAFLKKIPYENCFYVGDDRQNIYSFRNGTANLLKSMVRDPGFKNYYLIDNYRNPPNILEFASEQLRGMLPESPDSNPIKQKDGIIEEGIPFEDALYEVGASGNWGSWFILTRTNAEREKAAAILEQLNYPFITFQKSDIETIEELEKIMNDNTIKLITIHGSKGLENKNVIVVGAKRYNNEEKRISYVAATRAEHSLYWCPSIITRKEKNNYNTKKKTTLDVKKKRREVGMVNF